MNKGQMSMEYIIKIMILLVVVAVVISLIVKFKGEIQVMVKNLFGPKENNHKFPQIIEKNSFSSGEVSAYIENCYFSMKSLPEDEQEDIICYLLQSNNGFSITSAMLRNKLSSELEDKVEITTEFQKDIIKIQYQDIGNKILVSD